MALDISVTSRVVPRRFVSAGDDLCKAHLRRLQREAGRLVAKHWATVERVAERLLERAKLTAAEVRALVDESWFVPRA